MSVLRHLFMQRLLFVIPFVIFSFCSCEKNKICETIPNIEDGDCIDSLLINDSTYCITVYDPVCGCDGLTYSNSCFAGISGITFYVEGECCN